MPRLLVTGTDKLVFQQRLTAPSQASHRGVGGATRIALKALGLRARRKPMDPRRNETLIEGTHVHLRLSPTAGHGLNALIGVGPEALHRSSGDAYHELCVVLGALSLSWSRLTGLPLMEPPRLYEIHLHADVLGVPLRHATWQRKLSEYCPLPLRTTQNRSARWTGLGNKHVHIYPKLEQALATPSAQFIFDVWRTAGWNGVDGPISRLEAVIPYAFLRKLGCAGGGAWRLDDIWQAFLDWLGIAGGKSPPGRRIRGFPAKLLRGATFEEIWDSPPGLVVPRSASPDQLERQAWGSLRWALHTLAAIQGIEPKGYALLARTIAELQVDLDPELDSQLAVEVGASRLRLGLSSSLPCLTGRPPVTGRPEERGEKPD